MKKCLAYSNWNGGSQDTQTFGPIFFYDKNELIPMYLTSIHSSNAKKYEK